VAASDWDQPGTTIGQDLSFRPYVSDAVKLGAGRFYGVGHHEPQARLLPVVCAAPRRRRARRRGREGQHRRGRDAWRKLPGDVLLIDERGVVILSTRDELKYRPVAPLDAAQRAEVQRSRPTAKRRCSRCTGRRCRRCARHAGRQPRRRGQLASTRTLQRAPGAWSRSTTWRRSRAARYAAITASLAMAVLLLAR
jgi:two-component system C4-dicarboxylate transport sensor histidine kinase DctB